MERFYVHNLLPAPLLWRMLHFDGEQHFYRELGFSGKRSNGESYYWRDKENTIVDQESFYSALRQRLPLQLHFDVLSHSREKDRRALREEREIVMDIDLTDFVRYCRCGEEKRACPVCWLHVEGASFILHHLLTRRYGVEERHLLWVFSGMKGFHCVVNDRRLTRLANEQRLRLFKLLSRPTLEDKKQFLAELTVDDADFVAALETLFDERVIRHRDLLRQQTFSDACLTMVRRHFPALHNTLTLDWYRLRDEHSTVRWQRLLTLQRGQFDGYVTPSLLIALHCYYPCVDKGPLCMQHLFKLPFSVHATTGRIALPVERHELISDTLPSDALTLAQLQAAYDGSSEESIAPAFMRGCHLLDAWLAHYH